MMPSTPSTHSAPTDADVCSTLPPLANSRLNAGQKKRLYSTLSAETESESDAVLQHSIDHRESLARPAPWSLTRLISSTRHAGSLLSISSSINACSMESIELHEQESATTSSKVSKIQTGHLIDKAVPAIAPMHLRASHSCWQLMFKVWLVSAIAVLVLPMLEPAWFAPAPPPPSLPPWPPPLQRVT